MKKVMAILVAVLIVSISCSKKQGIEPGSENQPAVLQEIIVPGNDVKGSLDFAFSMNGTKGFSKALTKAAGDWTGKIIISGAGLTQPYTANISRDSIANGRVKITLPIGDKTIKITIKYERNDGTLDTYEGTGSVTIQAGNNQLTITLKQVSNNGSVIVNGQNERLINVTLIDKTKGWLITNATFTVKSGATVVKTYIINDMAQEVYIPIQGEQVSQIATPYTYEITHADYNTVTGTLKVSMNEMEVDGVLLQQDYQYLNFQKMMERKSTVPLSNNADLSNLVLSDGVALTPAFNASTLNYTANTTLASIALTASASEAHAIIKINGTVVASGTESGAITLNTGENNIAVEVTAQDGVAKKSYQVKITKDSTIPNYAFYKEISSSPNANDGKFYQPNAMAFDSNGNIYITDAGNFRIQKFDPNGNFIKKWGGYGSGSYQFYNPSSITIDNQNFVYVLDKNKIIKKYDTEGNYIGQWEVTGYPNQNIGIRAITSDKENNIYAIEGSLGYLFKYNSSGTLTWRFENKGTGDTQFNDSVDLYVDETNNIFILNRSVNQDKYYLQKFNENKEFVWKLDVALQGSNLAIGFAIGGDGSIYFAEFDTSKVKKYNQNREFVLEWGSIGSIDGQIKQPYRIRERNNQIYVVEYGNHRVQLFNTNGLFLSKIGSQSHTGNGEFRNPSDIAIDNLNNFYVVDGTNNRIQKFNSNGNFITKWGSYGNGNGQFSGPSKIAIDSQNNLYVFDRGNYRIQKFDSNGNYITQWGQNGSQDGQFSDLYSIAVDGNDNVYTTHYWPSRKIQKFSSSGVFITKYLDYSNGILNFMMPFSLTFDKNNLFYVLDQNNNPSNSTINILNANGNLNSFIQCPQAYPSDITIKNKYLFLNTSYEVWIYDLENSNNFITKFNILTNTGINNPDSIGIDNQYNAYIVDSQNHNVRIFKKQ